MIWVLLGALGVFITKDFGLSPGEETDRFSAEEAIRMIASGAAVPADPIPDLETAVRAVVNRETRRRKAKS